jgi:hypothetical protein
MGWLLIFAIKPAVEMIPRTGLHLLLSGGLFYSLGLIFYAWKQFLFHHTIWHLFVLAGSICHYFAVYYHVIPRAAIYIAMECQQSRSTSMRNSSDSSPSANLIIRAMV